MWGVREGPWKVTFDQKLAREGMSKVSGAGELKGGLEVGVEWEGGGGERGPSEACSQWGLGTERVCRHRGVGGGGSSLDEAGFPCPRLRNVLQVE